MQYLTKFRLGLVTLALIAGANNAYAVGTDAGVTVTNSVVLDYTVNGGALQAVADADFVVDRKLSLVVSTSDLDYVDVTPGQVFASQTGVPALTFSVTNTGNSAAPVLVGVSDGNGTLVTGFAGTPTGTFNESAFALAFDVNGNGVFDDGTDTLITPVAGQNYFDLGTVAEDGVSTVLLVADVPAAAVDGDNATFTLVATHHDGALAPILADESGNVAPSATAIAANDEADDPLTVQNVFADIAGADVEDIRYDFASTPDVLFAGQDDASNGQHSDTSSFIVANVELQVAKTVEVLYDPINGNKYDAAGDLAVPAVNPKAIPGAVLMYAIGMNNNEPAGGVPVEAIVIADDVQDGATAADLEPVDEGNQSGATVNVPNTVVVDVDPTVAGVNNRTFTLTPGLDLDEVHVLVCGPTSPTNPSAQNYTAATTVGGNDQANPEVAVNIGDCDPAEEAYVIYFVTVGAL